ncbi:hypothetical protein [Candidatus Methanoperedens sp. BLZ2]|nr:hypothetical protein [Candidatus Methanoperedens sp. BLZ2]MBZ0175577.1 hypothetical protein [Candidatus Methanoperedens nitroreducens]
MTDTRNRHPTFLSMRDDNTSSIQVRAVNAPGYPPRTIQKMAARHRSVRN